MRRQGLIKYEGYFTDGKMTGLGKMVIGEKTIIGNFICGISEGFAIVINLDRILRGVYINGRIKNEEELDIKELDLS